MSIPYKGITDKLISELIVQKGFTHVYETARKIVKQYHSGSQPVSNPLGHFRSLVIDGMEAPHGYISGAEEHRLKQEEEKRWEESPPPVRLGRGPCLASVLERGNCKEV